jgi:hypothetical protein
MNAPAAILNDPADLLNADLARVIDLLGATRTKPAFEHGKYQSAKHREVKVVERTVDEHIKVVIDLSRRSPASRPESGFACNGPIVHIYARGRDEKSCQSQRRTVPKWSRVWSEKAGKIRGAQVTINFRRRG